MVQNLVARSKLKIQWPFGTIARVFDICFKYRGQRLRKKRVHGLLQLLGRFFGDIDEPRLGIGCPEPANACLFEIIQYLEAAAGIIWRDNRCSPAAVIGRGASRKALEQTSNRHIC